jgi:hypothetical protein
LSFSHHPHRYAANLATKNFHCGKISIEVYSKKTYLGRVGNWNALPFKSAIFSLAGMSGKVNFKREEHVS